MSESGLYPVQSWLWSELDDLGIDGVIYSRHILDLIMSSKHAMDYRLAEKEQNIFSKIAPGGKKRKQKYSRRSSSFSACEEILWKKEIAVACLLSAVDAKTDSGDTASTIQQVVDELYVKLAGLHLTSDSKKSNSDDEYMASDHLNSRIEIDKPKKKENYEDAFPSLDGANVSPLTSGLSDSIWHRSSREYESKSECDSDNKPPKAVSCKDIKNFSHNNDDMIHSKAKRRFIPHRVGSRSDDDVRENRKGVVVEKTKTQPFTKSNQPTKTWGSTKQNRFPKKLKSHGKGQTGSQGHELGQVQQKRLFRPRYGQNSRLYRRNSGNETTKYKYEQKKRFRINKSINGNDKKQTRNTENNNKEIEIGQSSTAGQELGNIDVNMNMQEYAHLPSWMETTLTDISNPNLWFNNNFNSGLVLFDNGQEIASQESDSTQEMAFSSKWFRDPETGFLTFQPAKVIKDRSTSSSSGSRSSSSGGGEDDLYDELQEKGEKLEPSAAESWMWCPSPSLWEDGQTSPVSRLQSVYKKEMLAFNNAEDEYVDDISGRIWEEYKTIFLDLQEMEENSEQETKSSFDGTESREKADGKFSDSGRNNMEENKNLQQDSDTKSCFSPRCNDVILDSQDFKHSPVSAGECSASSSYLSNEANSEEMTSRLLDDVWKYSSVNDGWSSGDDIRHSMEDIQKGQNVESSRFAELDPSVQQNDEYPWKGESLFLNGSDSIKQHEVWGGGDMPTVGKTELSVEDERMMNYIVDAMFSDLRGEVEYGEHDALDCFGLYSKKGDSRKPPCRRPGNIHDMFCVDCNYQMFSVNIQSLFLHSPIPNFSSRDYDPWQTKWKMNELFSDERPITSIPDLNNFLATFATVDRSSLQRQDKSWSHNASDRTDAKKKTVLDSITENDAWKTSLRIGNIWQNISGIRPVNVIYSENKREIDRKLVPSSETHFRPISATLGTESAEMTSENYIHNDVYSEVTAAPEPSLCDSNTKEQTQGIMNTKTGEITNKHDCDGLSEEPSFRMSFSKLGEDKSMQTALGIKAEHEISTCAQLYPRLPKANSR